MPVAQSLHRSSDAWLLVLTAVAGGLALWVLALHVRFRRRDRFWRDVLTGAEGVRLEGMLLEHAGDRSRLDARMDKLEGWLIDLEARMATAKRHVGLVRYDAFDDVGGAQSFALAVFDEQGNGALLTSLVGRADCRVYCTPLNGGRTERQLSEEERRAIEVARAPRPQKSPPS